MINSVILVGRVATDPELKYTPSGIAVTTFRVACDRPFTNAQGVREADFIDVQAWRQAAEFAGTYLKKGRLVAVEGRLQIRTYQAQDGTRRRVSEVVAGNLKALDRPDNDPVADQELLANTDPGAAPGPTEEPLVGVG
jgi:single-strand DNA-binding protein